MNTYKVINGPAPTTAAPASVTTGTEIKTLLQLKPALPISIVSWGISFDGSAAAAPGKVELIDTGSVAATVTAYTAADVMPHNNPDAPANTAGTSGTPLNLGTTHSGYTATNEGTITTARLLDLQLVAPTNQYVIQFPLGYYPTVKAGSILRVRVTFAAAINAYCWVVFEV